MDPLKNVFENLQAWIHLPSYQAERRADLFFSVYLVEALQDNLKKNPKINPVIIPEFPLKKSNNQSTKVDYLAVTASGSELILVELKTDEKSIRDSQMEYLLNAATMAPAKLFQNLVQIQTASKAKNKYAALQQAVHGMGVDVEGLKSVPKKSRVVFVKPTKNIDHKWVRKFQEKKIPLEAVSFLEFAETVGKHRDSLSGEFKKLLVEWGRKAEEKSAP